MEFIGKKLQEAVFTEGIFDQQKRIVLGLNRKRNMYVISETWTGGRL